MSPADKGLLEVFIHAGIFVVGYVAVIVVLGAIVKVLQKWEKL